MSNGQQPFDMVIYGGEVVDPSANLSGKLDVGIRDGKIAEVAAGLDRTGAKETIDASGGYVTPGLVDLHTHVYWGSTFWGIEPDPIAAKTGVTTWLDVGSAGGYSFPAFRRYVVESSKSQVFSLLNVSSIGLIGPTWELSNIDYCDLDLAATIVEANRDVILGIKARIDCNTTRGTGIEPLRLARELADGLGLPLMTHIGGGPPTIQEVIPYLRPNDIVTHCFTGHNMKLLDDNGKILPEITELRENGLILDIGHGAGSFSFDTAEKMLDQGVLPDAISTDVHQLAIQGPAFDMPTTLSKFLALGMSLSDVVARASSMPAAAMGRPDLGTIKPGSVADVAVFDLVEGDHTFQDIFLKERKGEVQMINRVTVRGGEVMERVPYPKLMPWAVLMEPQRSGVKKIVDVPEKDPAPLLDNR